MSLIGTTVVLGAVVVLLVRLRAVRLGSALTCGLFGFALAVTPVGPNVLHVLTAGGSWLWSTVSTL